MDSPLSYEVRKAVANVVLLESGYYQFFFQRNYFKKHCYRLFAYVCGNGGLSFLGGKLTKVLKERKVFV